VGLGSQDLVALVRKIRSQAVAAASSDGAVEGINVMKIAKDSAVKARVQAVTIGVMGQQQMTPSDCRPAWPF